MEDAPPLPPPCEPPPNDDGHLAFVIHIGNYFKVCLLRLGATGIFLYMCMHQRRHKAKAGNEDLPAGVKAYKNWRLGVRQKRSHILSVCGFGCAQGLLRMSM